MQLLAAGFLLLMLAVVGLVMVFGVVGVRVEIVRCTDYSYPASVECCLTDAHGRLCSFVGKVPIVIAARLHAASPFPQPGVIACEVVGRRQDGGREVVAIDTERPWHVEATTGETRFEVGTEHVIEFNWGWPAKDARQAESGAAADGGLALDFKLLKASRGSFGPEVAAAAENVMRYLDGVLDQELLSREMSNRPIFKLPRDYSTTNRAINSAATTVSHSTSRIVKRNMGGS